MLLNNTNMFLNKEGVEGGVHKTVKPLSKIMFGMSCHGESAHHRGHFVAKLINVHWKKVTVSCE